MTRYYFDIRDGGGLYPDEEGLEFKTQSEAEIEAAHSLANLARDLTTVGGRTDVAVEVRTEGGPIFQAALIFETCKTKQ